MSTYSSNLRIELPTSGTQAGVWGDTTNNNLAYILDTAVSGYQTVSVTSASQALTYTNGPASTAASNQSVYAMLRFTTTTGAAFSVYAPPASKMYIIWNNSGHSATLYNSTVIGNTTAAGAGVVIANGNKVLVWSDGTNFYEIKSENVTGVVPVANGGTGQTTANTALNALLPVQTSNANKYLQTDGTNSSWDAISLSTSDITGTLAATNGGTGQSAYTIGDTLYSSATNTLAKLAGNTTTTRKYLVSVGDGTNATAPSWDQIDISTSDITGTLAVTNGGTGQATALTQYGVIYGSTTTAMATTLAGTSTQVLHGNASGAPTWGSVSLSADVSGTLPVANGGTGVATSTGTGSTVLSASPALTGTPTAPTAAATTDSTQIATTAFVRDIVPTGVITMWYGSIASIPTGWLLCDGTNSTPDLRDKFIVGAGSTYAVTTAGGSADAIVVSHTHTATSTFTGSALGTHTHTATDSGHTHTLAGNAYIGGIGPVGGGANLTNASTVTTATGTANISVSSVSAGTPAGTVATTNSTEGASGTGANLPPYYALAYIMKA